MTKNEFWTLNVVGAAVALVLLLNVFLGYSNRSYAKDIQQTQTSLANFEKVAQNLLFRIAAASRNDKALQDLLAKYKFEVKFQENQTPTP